MKCNHKWKEDEMFASGAVVLISGTPQDLGEETLVICQKCGERRYIRLKDLGSLMDMYKSTLDK
jgi:hypothetical protein